MDIFEEVMVKFETDENPDSGTKTTPWMLRDELRVRIGLMDTKIKLVGRVLDEFVEGVSDDYNEVRILWDVRAGIINRSLGMVRICLGAGTDALKYWSTDPKQVTEDTVLADGTIQSKTRTVREPRGHDLNSLLFADESDVLGKYVRWEKKNASFIQSIGMVVLGIDALNTLEGVVDGYLDSLIYDNDDLDGLNGKSFEEVSAGRNGGETELSAFVDKLNKAEEKRVKARERVVGRDEE